MAWWTRSKSAKSDPIAEEQLAIAIAATTPEIRNDAALSQMQSWNDLFGSFQRSNGLYSVTPENALRSSAVYACVRLIAGSIAALPLRVYAKKSHQEREIAADHVAQPLLAVEPNPTLSAMMFWETVIWHMLLRGNAYAVIRRNRNGRPLALELFQPGGANAVFERIDGIPRLKYRTSNDQGQRTYDQDDILHFPCFGWDGTKSFTPIAYAGQNAIGISLAADEHSAAFFGNGARPDIAISYAGKVQREQADLLREYWKKTHGGPDAGQWRLPIILGNEAKIHQLQMTSEDAQLLEARRYQTADIARIFGVPPHLIGETEKTTSWGSGIEEQTRGFLVFTLMSHVERIEQELNRKLIRDPNYFAEFDVAGLQRADLKSRYESYNIARGGTQGPGIMTVNEIRRVENMPPIAGGDELFRPAPAKAVEIPAPLT